MSKSHRSLCVSFSRIGAGLCIYHLLVWTNLNFLHISQLITLPTHSCLVLYSFCANLLHSLIIGLIVSSLSPHRLHLPFCWVLSILALIWLVLMALSYNAYYYYYYYYYYYSIVSFTPALADDFPLESEWYQVSSSLQDSSQYSSLSHQCCSFDDAHSSSYFHVPVPILWWLYQVHHLQLVSTSLSCSIDVSVL